ncbi:MAG: hypothetical protein JJU31_07140 [Wenzhouxiangella sp.]|nr:hypothetical protein [Wenzhouxiangella sp.]MCH8478873.1 hypothetical protein [Wenzhouxiangella sp.]
MRWEVVKVSPEFFVGITWEHISRKVRSANPVLLVCDIPQCKWTVVHALSPVGFIFKSVAVYPAFENAISEWLTTIANDSDVRKLFIGILRGLGIRKDDSEVFYFGEYPNRMSGFGESEGWELLRMGRHMSLTTPQSLGGSAIEYLFNQLDSFGKGSFEGFPENQELYDPSSPESLTDNSGWLFEDRGNSEFVGASLPRLSHLRQSQIRSLKFEIDHVRRYGGLHCRVLKRFISKHPLLVVPALSSITSGMSVLSADSEDTEPDHRLIYELRDLEVEVFRLRAMLVRALDSLMFYESALYALQENSLDSTVRYNLMSYVENIEKQYPVVCQHPKIYRDAE